MHEQRVQHQVPQEKNKTEKKRRTKEQKKDIHCISPNQRDSAQTYPATAQAILDPLLGEARVFNWLVLERSSLHVHLTYRSDEMKI